MTFKINPVYFFQLSIQDSDLLVYTVGSSNRLKEHLSHFESSFGVSCKNLRGCLLSRGGLGIFVVDHLFGFVLTQEGCPS